MVQFEFYLSNEDYERLYALKREMGRSELSGNEFARYLLELDLYRRHPAKVRDTELGIREEVNA